MTQWPGVRYDYTGASVLVTGGTSGIGAGIAQAYRAAGARVTVTGTRGAASEYDADLQAMSYLPMRLEDPASIEDVAGRLGSLDILVNNAGAVWPGGQSEYQPDVFEEALRINLGAAFRLSHGCRSLLASSSWPGGASLVGVASMASYFGIEVVPGYGAAKAGLVQMTKTLAVAWAKERIRVNAVAPGLTESRMTTPHLSDGAALAATLARTPMHRVAQPGDIAGVVLFLTSSAASYVTGQTLPVDGGYSIS